MAANDLAVLSATVGQDVLDKVITELVARNYRMSAFSNSQAWTSILTVDQGHAGTILATFADTLQIPVKEFGVTDLEALLNDL